VHPEELWRDYPAEESVDTLGKLFGGCAKCLRIKGLLRHIGIEVEDPTRLVSWFHAWIERCLLGEKPPSAMKLHACGQPVEGIDEVMALGHTTAEIDPCSAEHLRLHELVDASEQLRVGDAVDVAEAKPLTKP